MEILASLDDINANLPPNFQATDQNTVLPQVSVARIIRGYLSRIYSPLTLSTWATPAATPEIIREVAAKLIAAQVYFNKSASTSLEITDENFAQKMYNEAMDILRQIIAGEIVLPDILPDTPTEALSLEDFWPIDDTNRAFTMALRLD